MSDEESRATTTREEEKRGKEEKDTDKDADGWIDGRDRGSRATRERAPPRETPQRGPETPPLLLSPSVCYIFVPRGWTSRPDMASAITSASTPPHPLPPPTLAPPPGRACVHRFPWPATARLSSRVEPIARDSERSCDKGTAICAGRQTRFRRAHPTAAPPASPRSAPRPVSPLPEGRRARPKATRPASSSDRGARGTLSADMPTKPNETTLASASTNTTRETVDQRRSVHVPSRSANARRARALISSATPQPLARNLRLDPRQLPPPLP